MTMTPRCQHRTHRAWTTAASRPWRVLGALALGLALMTLARPALAGAGSELAHALARQAGALERSGPGARVRIAFDSNRVLVGVVAGPDGARAVVHNLSDPPPSGPLATPLSLPPGGSFLAPAGNWAWNVSSPGALEIEVYDGSLAAFRVVDGRAVPAEVVDPGGLWSLYSPRQIRWGLLLWMVLLGTGLLVLARNVFALPIRPRWGALLVVLALLPILPALSGERLFGPFDLQIGAAPWRGPLQGPPFEPATTRLSDISTHLVPWQTEVRRQLLAGRVPLLDQRVGAGQALLGNGQSAPFSLLTLASLPFDPPNAQALRAFLKVLLALLGTFLAARLLGVREGYALAAALGYALCGSIAVWMLHPHTEVMGLWPWLYIGVEQLIRGERRGRPAVLAGAALTGMLLAGHPETAAMAVGAIAVRWIWQGVCGGWRDARPGAARFAVACLAAGGLAAMAILPLVGTIPSSMKVAAVADEGAAWSHANPHLQLSSLIHVAIPGVFGTWQDGTYRGIGTFPKVSEGAVGLGLLALAAAALPLLRRRSPRETVLPLLAAGGFAIQSLAFGLDRVWAALPGISHVAPRYAAYIAAFALALLGSLGLERLTSAEPGRRRRLALVLGLGAGALLVAAPVIAGSIAGLDGVPRWVARLQVVSRPTVAWAVAGLALPAIACLVRRRPAWVAAAAAVIVAGQLAIPFHDYIPTVPSAFGYPELPLFDELQSADSGRLIGTRGVLVPNLACVYGFDDVRAHDPTTWARYDRWLERVLDLQRDAQIAQYLNPRPDHRAPLAALATRYLIARDGLPVPPPWRDRGAFGSVRLWELDREPQWAFFPREVIGAESAEEAFSLTRGDRAPEALAPIEATGLTADAPDDRQQTGGTARALGVDRRGDSDPGARQHPRRCVAGRLPGRDPRLASDHRRAADADRTGVRCSDRRPRASGRAPRGSPLPPPGLADRSADLRPHRGSSARRSRPRSPAPPSSGAAASPHRNELAKYRVSPRIVTTRSARAARSTVGSPTSPPRVATRAASRTPTPAGAPGVRKPAAHDRENAAMTTPVAWGLGTPPTATTSQASTRPPARKKSR